ncbi:MAG TPA: alpha/beta fold hydrolase [Dermatophilaceae bacterium]
MVAEGSVGVARDASQPERQGHVGLVVLGSLLVGFLLALILAGIVFGGGTEPTITGVVLLSFAAGLGLLAWLSSRRTDQPQRWALIPAAFFGVLGFAHVVFRPSDGVLRAFGWVWPIALVVLVVWMIRASRRSLRSWSRPVVLYPVFAVLLLAAVGGAFERISETAAANAMPGQLVDVGGFKMHISCTGSGSPTVILEPGLGEPGVMMAGWIQPAVATTTKVCIYDRPGKGFSEPAPTPRDSIANAADLHTLLARAHVGGPYVLVGHSSGGPYIKVYASKYPDQVAGMVLLDAQPSDAFAKLPGFPTFYNVLRKGTGLLPSVARLGAMRLFYSTAVPGLPPQARSEERADWSRPSHYRSLRDEVLELHSALTQSHALTTLGSKPLIVVTAVKDAQKGWMPLQNEMLTLSTNSVHRVIQNATHISLTEDKTESGISSQAVLDVVDAVRSGTPLTR